MLYLSGRFSHTEMVICRFCRKLKRLNLGGNALTEVPQKALAILDMLKKLEMQENRLTTIREGDFEGTATSIISFLAALLIIFFLYRIT